MKERKALLGIWTSFLCLSGARRFVGSRRRENYVRASVGNNNTSYGQTTAVMDEVENSELLMRFRTDDPGDDRRIRLWLRADDYRSQGTTFAKNGYGVEIETKSKTVKLIQSKTTAVQR